MKVKRYQFWFVKWLTLKIYGPDLLCNDAAMWIFNVRLLMLFLISAECVSWGYAAWQIAGGKFATVLSACAILTAFTLNWTLDGSIMTLDRGRSLGSEPSDDQHKQSQIARYKILALVAFRSVMISAVLYASSAFLVQALFNKDIETALANENRSRIVQSEKGILAPLQARRSSLTDQIGKKELEVTREAQGLSPTGRAGCRDACEVLQEQLRALRVELAKTEKDMATIQQTFEHGSPSDLGNEFQINILGDGIAARGQIVDKFKHSDGFKRTEHSIQAVLVFLFAGLLVLKLYQPPSVALYYCSALQDLWKRYQSGSFNQLLQPKQYSTSESGGMTPFEFDKWVRDVYLKGEVDQMYRQAQATLDSDQASRQAALKIQEQQVQDELEKLNQQLRDTSARATTLERQIKEAEIEARNLSAALAEFGKERTRLIQALSGQGIPLAALAGILERKEAIEVHLYRDAAALNVLEATLAEQATQLATMRFERGTLANDVAEMRAVAKTLRSESAALQQGYLTRSKDLWYEQDELIHLKLSEMKPGAGERRSKWGRRAA